MDFKQLVEAEFRGRKKFIEVVTDIEPAENFFPVEDDAAIFFAERQNIDESATFDGGGFFLRVPYEDFFALLNRDFCGAGFTYQFKPNYRLVAAEEKIFRVGRIYGESVLIFSPYARRAVDVAIFGEPQELNFRFAENGLDGKILAGKKLYRNVEIRSAKNFYDETFDEATYLLPVTPLEFDDDFVTKRIDGKIYFDTSQEIYAEDCEIVRILPTRSHIEPRIFSKQHLRTTCDIEFVLSGLAREGYSCRFGNFGDGSGKKIRRYSSEHRYFSVRDEKFLRAKMRLPVCTVKFSGDEIFLTDYANFVLQFLDENYPEFNWAGEHDDGK